MVDLTKDPDGWYLARNGHPIGPMALTALADLAPTDTELVWHPTLGDWTDAPHVPPLQAILRQRARDKARNPPPMPNRPAPVATPAPTPAPAARPTPAPAAHNASAFGANYMPPAVPTHPYDPNAPGHHGYHAPEKPWYRKAGTIWGLAIAGALVILLAFAGYKADLDREAENIATDQALLEAEQKRLTNERESALRRAKQAREDSVANESARVAEKNRRLEYANAHLAELVTVKTNNYAVNELMGGIEGVTATVSNDSEFLLDNVTVEVTYVLENGSVFKTETLKTGPIGSVSGKTFDAPPSERGKTVRVKISAIDSRALGIGDRYRPDRYEPEQDATNLGNVVKEDDVVKKGGRRSREGF